MSTRLDLRRGAVGLLTIACATATVGCAGPASTDAGTALGPPASWSGGLSAACAAPQAAAEPATVAPGGLLTVTGRDFLATCRDTGGGPNVPASEVQVVLVQAGRPPVVLGTAQVAGRGAAISVHLVVPASAGGGPAELLVGTAAPVGLLIEG